MPTFRPGDPWPDQTYGGGAVSEHWSGFVRFLLQAQIAAGNPWRLGPDPSDRLNAGNVMSAVGLSRVVQPSGLWVDLSRDLIDVDIGLGATASHGVLTKTDAGTLTATLYDPDGKYDPLNPSGPYALGHATRLIPGVQIRSFVEIINDPNSGANPLSVSRFPLFTGTADRWETGWQQHPGERQTKLVATDTTKQFVKMNREEQPPQGGGQSTAARLFLIVNFHQANVNLVQQGSNVGVTLQATTLAQSAWELVSRTLDDELGLAWFAPSPPDAVWNPILAWTTRSVWTDPPATGNTINIGCAPPGDPAPQNWFDIAVDARPASFDALLHNAVDASRSGGSMQHASNQQSVDRFGRQALQRTDLGLNDDPQVARWAQFIVDKGSYPQTVLEQLVLEPALDGLRFQRRETPRRVWWPNFVWLFLFRAMQLMTARNRVRFDAGYVVDVQFRLVGVQHKISFDRWEITWHTAPWSIVPVTISFHMGAHPNDRLDAGFLMGG